MSSRKFLMMTMIGAGALLASAASASAGVACVGPVCWHTTDRYEYPSESRVIIHDDTWKPTADAHVTWREHKGRGYWRDDKWVEW